MQIACVRPGTFPGAHERASWRSSWSAEVTSHHQAVPFSTTGHDDVPVCLHGRGRPPGIKGEIESEEHEPIRTERCVYVTAGREPTQLEEQLRPGAATVAPAEHDAPVGLDRQGARHIDVAGDHDTAVLEGGVERAIDVEAREEASRLEGVAPAPTGNDDPSRGCVERHRRRPDLPSESQFSQSRTVA